MTRSSVAAAIEAVLFVAEKPVSRAELAKTIGSGQKAVSEGLAELGEWYQGTGLRLQYEGDDWQIVTAPEQAPFVAAYLGADRLRLSGAALETLSVVAYRQPATRAEVESIRGVNCDQTIYTLMQRRLIEELGRREAPGVRSSTARPGSSSSASASRPSTRCPRSCRRRVCGAASRYRPNEDAHTFERGSGPAGEAGHARTTDARTPAWPRPWTGARTRARSRSRDPTPRAPGRVARASASLRPAGPGFARRGRAPVKATARPGFAGPCRAPVKGHLEGPQDPRGARRGIAASRGGAHRRGPRDQPGPAGEDR